MEQTELLSIFKELAHGRNPESGKKIATNSVARLPKVKEALKAAIGIIHEYSRKADGPINMGKYWTKQDELTLLTLRSKGYSDKTIATELGRTAKSVSMHLEKLRVKSYWPTRGR